MNRRTRRGQGLTEYILLVSLVSIATIGIVTLFGDNVRRLFAMSADSLAGESHVAMANDPTAVQNLSLNRKTLKQFAAHNFY